MFELDANDTAYRADIEQEVNGLYTFDRKEKLDSSRVKALMDDGMRIFYERVNK